MLGKGGEGLVQAGCECWSREKTGRIEDPWYTMAYMGSGCLCKCTQDPGPGPHWPTLERQLTDSAHVPSVSHPQEPTPTGFNNKGNLLLHVMRDLASGVAGSSTQLIPQESDSFYRPINLPPCRHHSFVV